jgi:hypothetical protein
LGTCPGNSSKELYLIRHFEVGFLLYLSLQRLGM